MNINSCVRQCSPDLKMTNIQMNICGWGGESLSLSKHQLLFCFQQEHYRMQSTSSPYFSTKLSFSKDVVGFFFSPFFHHHLNVVGITRASQPNSPVVKNLQQWALVPTLFLGTLIMQLHPNAFCSKSGVSKSWKGREKYGISTPFSHTWSSRSAMKDKHSLKKKKKSTKRWT